MTEKEYLDILGRLCVPCRDNGSHFTETDRLEAIDEILSEYNSPYKRRNYSGLFALYSRVNPKTVKNAVVISSHIDCVRSIREFYSRETDDGFLHGTYDNAITDAASLIAMLGGRLPDNVFVAFTGDEEENSRGAADLCEYLQELCGVEFFAIVTDVTHDGFEDGASFTVENDFLYDEELSAVASIAQECGCIWRYVPETLGDIPECITPSHFVPHESLEDESWEYDENDVSCFSLCLPCSGNMHSGKGVKIRQRSFLDYCDVLPKMATELYCKFYN